MVRKVFIGSMLLIVVLVGAFIAHVPVASDAYPEDLSVAQYIENYRSVLKKHQDVVMHSGKPTYQEAEAYFNSIARTLTFPPTASTTLEAVGKVYEKENKLSLPRGKKTEGLSLSERWTRWQFNRFFAKNYPNAKEMMALQEEWLKEIDPQTFEKDKKTCPLDLAPYTYKDGTVIGYSMGVSYVIKMAND